ncbi:hypothetical protein SMC26_15350 [Actinomadura fulvescens]
MKYASHDDPNRFAKEAHGRFMEQLHEDSLRARREGRHAGGLREILAVVLLIVGGLLVARYYGHTPAGLWDRVELWLNG